MEIAASCKIEMALSVVLVIFAQMLAINEVFRSVFSLFFFFFVGSLRTLSVPESPPGYLFRVPSISNATVFRRTEFGAVRFEGLKMYFAIYSINKVNIDKCSAPENTEQRQ